MRTPANLRWNYALAGGLMLLGSSATALASSHREAPLLANDPLADSTDFYMFVSPDRPDSVTFIANFIPLEEPAGGPNFYKFDDSAQYDIKIDNNGDATEDITFRFTFKTKTTNPNTFLYNVGQVTSLDDPDLNVRQTMTVQQIAYGITSTLGNNFTVAPCNVGPTSMPDYASLAEEAVYPTFISSIKVFAGQRDEAFYVDLGSIFDLLQVRALTGGEPTDNTAGFNVHTIAIQVPIKLLTRNSSVPTDPADPNAIIGAWTTVSRPSTRIMTAQGNVAYAGSQIQVSRLGQPLVNEVVIPQGFKNRFSASKPKDDAQFLSYVQYPEVADLYNLLFGIDTSALEPREDLVAIFLTGLAGLNQPPNVKPSEQLRLNMAIPPSLEPHRMGVLAGDNAGFPNGRRLIDDTVDIELQALAGILYEDYAATASTLTDGVDINDLPELEVFPYMPLPRSGFDSPHGITY